MACFPRDTCSSIYATATGYTASITNLNAITFATDNVFSDGTTGEMAALSGGIVKGTGLDPKIATEALNNAYPDYRMYRTQTKAIAVMMKDLKYVSSDVSSLAEKNMDYSFLMSVTGKPKTELGY